MSAFPLKADIRRQGSEVRFLPNPEVSNLSWRQLRPVVPARPLVPSDSIVRPLKAAAVPVTYMTANVIRPKSSSGVDSHGEPESSHHLDRCLRYSARSERSPPSARPKKASVHRFIGCEWVGGIAGVYETSVAA
jgi:hypothetical protein